MGCGRVRQDMWGGGGFGGCVVCDDGSMVYEGGVRCWVLET